MLEKKSIGCGRLIRPVMDLIYPRICSLCLVTIVDPQRESLCSDCEAKLTATEVRCLRCSAPVVLSPIQTKDSLKHCYYCERRKWSFRRAHCFTAYHGLAARATKKIKHAGQEPLAHALGTILANWLIEPAQLGDMAFDWVVPIPQHWVRRVTTRYNQSEVLAERVAKSMGVPMNRRLLYRTRWTEKQGTKSIQQRLSSVMNSFECRRPAAIRGSRVLLVDDVVTSGATVNDAARALRQAGAKRVEVAAFARGVGAVKG